MWFLLKNLITDITCFKATNVTLINVLLGNKWRCFHHTAYLWNRLTWLSQTNTSILQRLLRNFLRNNIEYRNYENFNENNFLHELDQELSKESTYEQKHHQYVFTNIFWMFLDKHALIKKKNSQREWSTATRLEPTTT